MNKELKVVKARVDKNVFYCFKTTLIKENATNLFESFTKESLYKNRDDILVIPINHIATIILGDSRLCNINDLFITLSELTKINVDFFNISSVLDEVKEYLLSNYPSLSNIEKYKTINKSEKDIISSITREYGNSFEVGLEMNKTMSI